MPDSAPTLEIPALFEATAKAVRSAQIALDEQILHYPDASYTIPRVSVNTKISVKHDGSEVLANSVGFDLLTVPDPPPPGPDASSLDSLPSRVVLPPFLVASADRSRLLAILDTAFASPARYRFEVPEPVDTTDLAVENRLLRNAHDSQDADTFIVLLRVSLAPEKYLIMRRGHRTFHNDRDGIYLLEPAADVPVTIYSFATSGQNSYYYAPFFLFFRTVRSWLAAGLPGIGSAAAAIPAQLGSLPVGEAAAKLRSDYIAGRTALAKSDAPSTPFAPPFFYHLGAVDAGLEYSRPREHDPDQPPFIESRAVVRIESDAAALTVRLVAPEFVLTGAARDSLLDIVVKTDDLPEALLVDENYEADYTAALTDPARRKAALFFLSYDADEPRDQFLVVWTGSLAGEEREFAFTCGFELGNLSVDLCLPLEDPRGGPGSIERPQRPFSEARLESGQYAAIRDLLRVVRMWDMRTQWSPV